MKKPVKKTFVQVTAKTPEKPIDNKKLRLWLALACAIFAFLLYANTMGHEYTVDDGTVISNNKITKKGISAIPEIFTSSYRAGFWDRKEGLYRPLSVAMFAVEWEVAPENPLPGHLINVFLYALTAFLLFITLSAMFSNYSVLFPLLSTLFFIVHPLHTEVISNIKSRDEILAFLFIILTLYFLYKYLSNKNIWFLAFSCFSFLMAYLSKESAITILAVVPLFIWFFSRESIRSNALISLSYFGITALYFLIRYNVLGEITGSAELQMINNSLLAASSPLDRFATAISIMGKYLYLLIIPHPLVFDYSYNQVPIVTLGSIQALFPLVICLLLAWYSWKNLKSKDPAAFGILFFFATISLVSNVLFLIESTMAERFLYLPSLGFSIAISYFILKYFKLLDTTAKFDFSSLTKKPLFITIISVAMILYSFKTISRNSEWESNFVLLEKDVKTSPNSARIRYAYGSALLIEKALKENNPNSKSVLLDKSIAELQKGVNILPDYAEAWYHLGIAHKEKGNIKESVFAFEKARSYKDFKTADFYISSGLSYGLDKKYDLAIVDFSKAIAIDPKNSEAYNNKGLYFTEKGVLDSAMLFLDMAIKLKPGFYEAWYNKGNTFAKGGDYQNAIVQYQQALKIKPGYIDALLNMGNSYAATKDYNNALKYFSLVEKEDPGNPKVLYNIAITYRILGDETNAAVYMEKAKKAGAGI